MKQLKNLLRVSVLFALISFASCEKPGVQPDPIKPVDPSVKPSPTITVGAIPTILPGDTTYNITFSTAHAVNVKVNGVLLNKTAGTYTISGSYTAQTVVFEAISAEPGIASATQTVTANFASKAYTDLSSGGTYVMYKNEGRASGFPGWSTHAVLCFNLDFSLDKTATNNRSFCTPAASLITGTYNLSDSDTKITTSFNSGTRFLQKATKDTLVLLEVSATNDSTRLSFVKQK